MSRHNQLTSLQDVALDLVAKEHQRVPSIADEVRLLLGNGISAEQITTALMSLRELRLVDAFIRDDAKSAFERYRRPKLKAGIELWWYATKAGQRINSTN